MKLKATKKEFNGMNVLKIGYCKAQNLLAHQSPFAYSSGVYGWSCDYYNVNGIIISTGYSPIGKDFDYETVRAYDLKAEKIRCNYDLSYDERKEKVNALLNELVEEFKKTL